MFTTITHRITLKAAGMLTLGILLMTGCGFTANVKPNQIQPTVSIAAELSNAIIFHSASSGGSLKQ